MSLLAPYDAIIFDKDGTLIDFQQSFGHACAYVVRHLSDGDEDIIKRIAEYSGFDMNTYHFHHDSFVIGDSTVEIAEKWQKFLPQFHNDLPRLMAEIDDGFQRLTLEYLSPFEATAPLLQQCKAQGKFLGVVSNDSALAIRQQLQKLSLYDLIDFIAGYDSGYGAKPSGGSLKHMMQFYDFKPEKSVMIGDSVHDLLAAQDAGIDSIAICHYQNIYSDLSQYTDKIITDIAELLG
jgi:phosphoglycolate phosphatase